MKKVKTANLTDAALDWAVAKCVNPAHGMVRTHQDNKDQWHVTLHGERGNYAPSTDWAQGGPIIEREKIDTAYSVDGWYATMYWRGLDVIPAGAAGDSFRCGGDGPTPLIAAMRCYVASKLGDEVEISEELL